MLRFRRLFVLVLCLLTFAAPVQAAGYDPFPAGQCTWFAALMRPDLVGAVYGDARDWPQEATIGGYRVGTRPEIGAVAVLQPGVQGADQFGHVAYVQRVGIGGWFLVSQRNWMPWPWRTSYTWFHSGWGVSFIYR